MINIRTCTLEQQSSNLEQHELRWFQSKSRFFHSGAVNVRSWGSRHTRLAEIFSHTPIQKIIFIWLNAAKIHQIFSIFPLNILGTSTFYSTKKMER